MRILLVAATTKELAFIQERVAEKSTLEVEYVISGVGMIATVYMLTNKLLNASYDLIINVGIAGAFDRSLKLGEVVEVIEDRFSEEFIEDGEEIRSYEEVGLRKYNDFPFREGVLKSSFTVDSLTIKKVNAITVNTVHGSEKSIQELQSRLKPQVESMEGAAFFYVCHQKKQACMQLRAISNYVEKRNRKAWEVDLALNNLAEQIVRLMNSFE